MSAPSFEVTSIAIAELGERKRQVRCWTLAAGRGLSPYAPRALRERMVAVLMAKTLDAFVSNAGATTKVNGAKRLCRRFDASMVHYATFLLFVSKLCLRSPIELICSFSLSL